MRRLWLAFLFCGVAASLAAGQGRPCRPKRHETVPAVAGLPYHQARKRLLAAGWRPLRTKSLKRAAADPDIASGNGPLFWKRGYVEIEACAGTGVAGCSFLFRDAYGARLRVTTRSEERPRERAHATVNEFYFVCPE